MPTFIFLMPDSIPRSFRTKCESLSIRPTLDFLAVSIADQSLLHYRDGVLQRTYSISTSKRAPSCQLHSLGTPWGLHRIAEKIGANAPAGMVFVGRKPTGKTYPEMTEEENQRHLITSRILRLSGLEPGLNQGGAVDTFARLVYIHGTNREDRIGSPDSAGCIVLRNREMIELFETVPEGSLVWIFDPDSALSCRPGEKPDRVS